MFDRNNALTTLKQLLQITDTKSDELLILLIDNCVARIKGYCRVDDLPEGLNYLVPVMAERVYKLGGYGSDSPGAITSIKQGERSISYESAVDIGGDWINDFEDQLEPYRKRRGRLPSEI